MSETKLSEVERDRAAWRDLCKDAARSLEATNRKYDETLARVELLMGLLIEARGLIAGLAADLLERGGTDAAAHDFHERLRIALAGKEVRDA